MKYIYYKDDFKVKLEFKDGDTPTPLDNVDFRGKLYTAYDKYSEGIPFSRIKGDVIGCDIGEDGSLTIVADNHGFRAGKLMVDMKYYIYNDEYADGTQTIARTYDLKTWLTTSQKLADGERPIEVNAIINLPLEVIVQQVKDLTEKGEQIVADADTAIANINTAIERANTAAESVEGAVESANAAANEARNAVESVSVVVEDATTATQRANSAADSANSAVEAANTATANANSAAEQARAAASDADSATESATAAAEAATSAATNANTAADNASQYADRYEDIANSLPIVAPDFEGAENDKGLRYVVRKNKLIAILKDGHVEYAPEGVAFVDAIEPTSFTIGNTTYEVPQGVSYVELGLTTPITTELYQKGIYNVSGIRRFGLYLDGSKNISLGLTFSSSADLEWLDLSGLDTSAVTYGFAMMRQNPKLHTILGKLSFPKVDRIDRTFLDNKALVNVDVSEMDLGMCKEVQSMFNGCSSLTSLDVSRWNTAACTNMGSMFYGCSSLTSLDVSRWNTAACTTMQGMFYGCSSLAALDVSGWNTAACTNMAYTFSGCSSLTTLDVSNWNTAACTNMNSMFGGCSSLTELDVSGWNTAACTSFHSMFRGCSKLQVLDCSNWDVSAVESFDSFIRVCRELKELKTNGFANSICTSIYCMFEVCNVLQVIDISGFDPTNVTDTRSTFRACFALTTLQWPMMGKIKADVEGGNNIIALSDSPLDRASLDSIFSYDRTANGLTNPLTVQLSSTSKALLTAEEIAAITAKGYTIV